MEKLTAFEALGLSAETIKALALKGFEEPTPIQEKTIPLLLAGGRNLIGQAQTGTGKTAAFGLPLIEKIAPDERDVQALILVPTRELAIQVAEEISSFKGKRRLQILPVYGGQSIDQQLRRLKKDVHIVVGTPGRIIDHIQRGTLKLANIKYMILDEADEMLNMGFIEDVEHILEQTPKEKTMLLFSATMPDEILRMAKKYMGDYETIKIKNQQMTTELTDQIYFEVNEEDKFEALSRIIDIEDEFYGLIFCRTKVDVDNVTSKLLDRGYEAEALHGDVSQHQRERILKKFKSQQLNILVATDVAAWGIDINDLSHVINFALPQD
ncbi:MAG: RNA helicase, partial [Spirochaetae bacterium HGW-Spirochaetae-6]